MYLFSDNKFVISGDISNDTINENEGSNNKVINFTMNTIEQAHHFGSKGFFGNVAVQFKVEKNVSEMDFVVKNDYFVNFYDLPGEVFEKKKHVILVTDLDSNKYLGSLSEILFKILANFPSYSLSFIPIVRNTIFQWSSVTEDGTQNSLQYFLKNITF